MAFPFLEHFGNTAAAVDRIAAELLLDRRDHVLGSLGYAELHHRLGLDLDGRAGLRVAAYAGLALCFH
jgi:hypothetical protein